MAQVFDRPAGSGPAYPINPPRSVPRSPLAVVALLLAVVLALVVAFSGFGSRWDWWHFSDGFTMLRYAAYASIGVGLLSLIALYRSRPSAPRRGLGMAALALVICVLIFGGLYATREWARQFPPIHDITTDMQNPPEFVDIAPLRADAPNPVEYQGEEVASVQEEAYPDIAPLELGISPEEVFGAALEAAEDMRGWEIVAANEDDGRIEATATTFWYGFKDDVVIRLTPSGDGTVVDVRSKSRIGRGDMGVNARRVRSYLQKVEARV